MELKIQSTIHNTSEDPYEGTLFCWGALQLYGAEAGEWADESRTAVYLRIEGDQTLTHISRLFLWVPTAWSGKVKLVRVNGSYTSGQFSYISGPLDILSIKNHRHQWRGRPGVILPPPVRVRHEVS